MADKQLWQVTPVATDVKNDDGVIIGGQTAGTRYAPLTLIANYVHNLWATFINAITPLKTSFASGDKFPLVNGSTATAIEADKLLELTSQNALVGNIAPEFIPSDKPNPTTTIVGQPYVYNGSLYVAKEAYQGAWDASKFIAVSVFDLLKESGRFLLDGSVEGTKLAYSLFDFSKTLSTAFIREDARLVAGQDTGYISAEGYSILGFPVKEGEYLHLNGHVDITTCFRFTTSPSQVTADYFVSRFFNKYDNEDQYYDIIIQVPVGATYIQVTIKDSWGTSLRMGTLKGFRGESFNEGSIEGNKLVDNLFGFSDSEKIVSAGVREGAKLTASKSSYVSATGYNVVGYPVTAGTKIHISGKIDTNTTFRFTDSVDQVMPANFVAFAFEKGTTTEENYDLFLDVPVGATYVQVTEKAAWGAEVYLCGNMVGIRGEALNDDSISGEKLKKELYDFPIVKSNSVYVRENAKLNANQQSAYSSATGYNVVGYPVTAGKKVRIVGKIDVTTSFRFTNSPSQVMPANYVAMAYNQTEEGTVNYDLLLDVPVGATYVQVTEKAAWGAEVYSIETEKKILAESVECLEGIKNSSNVITYKNLYVATTGNDTTGDGSKENPFATIFKANSVVSESDFYHRYRIYVADGTYNDLQTKYAGSTPTTYEGVVVAPYTEIIGNVADPSKVVLSWDGSYGYAEGVFNYNSYGFYKCLFHITSNSKVCAIKGFTFSCKNTRYALHIEIDGYGEGVSWEVSDCIFNWGGVDNRMSTPTIGTGSGHFEKGLLQRCKIANVLGATDGFRNHDSIYKYNSNKVKQGPVIRICDCDFGAGAQGDTIVLFRNIHNDSDVEGFDIVELENVVGISDFTYEVELPATICKWRAKVFACEIDNDVFNANGFEN